MTQEVYLDILQHIRTTSEAEEFIRIIDRLQISLFQANAPALSEILAKEVHASWAALLLHLLSQDASTEPAKRQEILKELKKVLESRPVIAITLAFEPPDSFVTELFSWMNQHVAKPCVLKLVWDDRILAGVIIEFAGRYVDLSLKTKLERFFEEKPEEIRRLL